MCVNVKDVAWQGMRPKAAARSFRNTQIMRKWELGCLYELQYVGDRRSSLLSHREVRLFGSLGVWSGMGCLDQAYRDQV